MLEPTIIPKPTISAAAFRKDYTLAEVIAICEQDPGCGFRLDGKSRSEIFFLDNEWWGESPTIACVNPVGTWLATMTVAAAAAKTWRLVDLSKHGKVVGRVHERYVGQTVSDRYYMPPIGLRGAG